MRSKGKYRWFKRVVILLAVMIISFWGYVLIVNRNTKDMTARQKVLKAVYPLWMRFSRMTGKNNSVLANKKNTSPSQSLYDLQVFLNNGDTLRLKSLQGKKILIVNTASDCGYTDQYSELQQLYEKYTDKLVIIGFPANDFKHQESRNDQQIAQFCKLNYGVTFPLAKKSVVIKSSGQHSIFQWLTHKNLNGWNDKAPSWNFSKYLVNEQGLLMDYFGPAVSPLGEEVEGAIGKKAMGDK